MFIYRHIPVMLKEAMNYLQPQAGGVYIDCTLGGGGYTREIAERIAPTGKVLAIDLDEKAISNAEEIINRSKINNIIIAQANFKDLSQITKKYFPAEQSSFVDGIIFDLGLSSAQLEDMERGFSFKHADAPLKMTFGQSQKNAEYVINCYKEEDLKKIFLLYGEERFTNRIVKAVADARRRAPIKTAGDLADLISRAVPAKFRNGRIHPATRIFQALRIEVNDELANLEAALPQAAAILKSGGKMVIVSYHSLEDRIVKNFLKQESKNCLCPPSYPACRCHHPARLKILTHKVVKPAEEEVMNNSRARSAKLRAAMRL